MTNIRRSSETNSMPLLSRIAGCCCHALSCKGKDLGLLMLPALTILVIAILLGVSRTATGVVLILELVLILKTCREQTHICYLHVFTTNKQALPPVTDHHRSAAKLVELTLNVHFRLVTTLKCSGSCEHCLTWLWQHPRTGCHRSAMGKRDCSSGVCSSSHRVTVLSHSCVMLTGSQRHQGS